MTRSAVWLRRRRRIERLCAEQSHAAELLTFYDDVLALQEPLYAKALKSRWLGAVEAADGRAPRLRLERIPERPRERDFSRFVRARAGVRDRGVEGRGVAAGLGAGRDVGAARRGAGPRVDRRCSRPGRL